MGTGVSADKELQGPLFEGSNRYIHSALGTFYNSSSANYWNDVSLLEVMRKEDDIVGYSRGCQDRD